MGEIPGLGAWENGPATAQLLRGVSQERCSWTCKLAVLQLPLHAGERRPSGPHSTVPQPDPLHPCPTGFPLSPPTQHLPTTPRVPPFPKGKRDPRMTMRSHASRAMPPQGSPGPIHVTVQPGHSSHPSPRAQPGCGRPQPHTSPPALSELPQFPSPVGFPVSKGEPGQSRT